MTNIRRYFTPNQLSFQTHVTHGRASILVNHFELLWKSITSVQADYPFKIIAWVVLPDHIHLLVDSNGTVMPSVVRQFKSRFSAAHRSLHRLTDGPLWQHRYWDHVIRDEEDLRRHIEYIHHNPVKHGLARGAKEYPHSSFGKFVSQGLYDETWGALDDEFKQMEFGE